MNFKFRLLTLALTGAVALGSLYGCATRSATLIRVSPSTHALTHRNTKGSARLDKVTLTFQTLKYGKKPTTGVWVLVVDNTWNTTLVRATNLARTQRLSNRYAVASARFRPGSVHILDLPFERSRYGYGFFASDKDANRILARIPRSQRRIWHKRNCEHLYFKIGFMPRSALLGTTGNTFGFEGTPTFSGYGGQDRWTFDAFLTLYFSDGSKLIYERKNLSLESRNGKLVFTKAG